jgi:hypothetical protein
LTIKLGELVPGRFDLGVEVEGRTAILNIVPVWPGSLRR